MARPSDFVGQNNEQNGNANNNQNNRPESFKVEFDNSAELEYLRSIDTTLKQLIKNSNTTSQSNARNSMYNRNDFRNPSGRRTGRFAGDAKSSFIDSFEKGIVDGILGSDFKDKIRGAMNEMADMVGLNLKDIPGEVGKALSTQAVEAFKNTELGQKVTGGINKYANAAMNSIMSRYKAGVDNYNKTHTDYKKADKDTASFSQYVKTQSGKSASSVESELSNTSVFDDILSHVAHIDAILYEKQVRQRDLDEDQQQSYNDYLKDEFNVDNPLTKKVADAKAEPESPKSEGPEISNLSDNKPDLDFGDKKFGEVFKESKLGQNLSSLKDKALSGFDSIFGEGKAGKAASFIKDAGSNLMGKVGLKTAGTAASTAATGTTAAGSIAATGSAGGAAAAGLTSVASAASAACPYILAAVAAITILNAAVNFFAADLKEAAKELYQDAKKAANRYKESRKQNMELAQKRLEEDTRTLVEAPFEILKEAAQKAYDVWDAQLRKINGTQGYSKSDLQNLMSAYAQRLRDENLSSVIGTTDVTENLAKVLDSGLSGQVAEEFAYIATKLNAAIPTQDFFGYADEYASVAANAIRQGKSQSEAIAYANSQLETFASTILYSSRQLAGGFTTGLKDAEKLFEDAVKISQAAKTNNASQIAGVMASVSAITGSIAPDLASSMTEAIVKAATGGNSSEIVALRSLAGINASNTEFLKQLANNPQKVFATLFDNLAKMQNMSEGAYMEVAEGLSSVFGLSMDAFSRIDFNYLADAIRNMNVSNASLDENMQLLISGQTTTTAEQLKLQQINKYMIDEGLAYVLDNEVARSIQEHMWAEQIAREQMEAEYSVNLQGSALKFLEGIKSTVENIINFLNPFAALSKLVNLVSTAAEGKAMESDIKQVLELGKVGNGNATSLKQLTTRNADLNVAPSIVNMMGGYSLYDSISSGMKAFNSLTHAGGGLFPVLSLATDTNFMNNLTGSLKSGIQAALTSSVKNLGVKSSYSWGTLGKSTYAAIAGGSTAKGSLVGAVAGQQAATTSLSSSVTKLNKMLEEDYINEFVKSGKNYDEWAASAKQMGISNLSAVIDEAGYTEDQLRSRFQAAQSAEGAKKNLERIQNEDEFWAKGKSFWEQTLVYESDMIAIGELNNSWLEKIFKKSDQFYNSWVDYFVNHTAYNNAYKYSDVERIKSENKAKESGDLVNALAEALVQNTVDLKDPQIQTNALLAQILIVAQAIMNQNNKVGGLSLPDSLNALALGLVQPGNTATL